MEEIRVDENGVENMEGHSGQVIHTGADGMPPLAPNDPIKYDDLEKIAAEIAAAEGTPNYDVLLQTYTGPDTGVTYDDETKTCHVADGFVVRDGVIIKE